MVGIDVVKDALIHCKKPLFIFDDDVDGLCAFLLLYRNVKVGRGMPAKSAKGVDEAFIRRVKEYDPDKVFILDIAVVSQEFLDEIDCEVVWIDHHPPLQRTKVLQYNPLINSDKEIRKPTSWLCYELVEENLWIAMAGIIGDWTLPKELVPKFREDFPDMLPENITTPEQALFSSDIGLLAKMFNFILKGEMKTILQCMKVLTKIADPQEILKQTTPEGKFIYKRFAHLNTYYEELLERAKPSESELLVFTYTGKYSFTSELSNELLFRHPDKVIVVAREKDGSMRSSLRSSKYNIRDMLQSTFTKIDGKGGGHENACGASIPIDQWDEFLSLLMESPR